MKTNLEKHEHEQLEKHCKTWCTRSLGWNKTNRHSCRENTMCQQCRELLEANSIRSVLLNIYNATEGFLTLLDDDSRSEAYSKDLKNLVKAREVSRKALFGDK